MGGNREDGSGFVVVGWQKRMLIIVDKAIRLGPPFDKAGWGRRKRKAGSAEGVEKQAVRKDSKVILIPSN